MAFDLSQVVSPRQIYLSRGSVGHLRDLTGQRAAIVCGQNSLARNGERVRIEGLLQAAGMESRVFSETRVDLDFDSIGILGRQLDAWAPDWIVAIGGGAVLNTAKAAWVTYEHPELSFTAEAPTPEIPPLRQRSRFLAIPTSSGTGADVTDYFLICDRSHGRKRMVRSRELVPDLVIVDSALTDSLPPSRTSASGFNALASAIESFVSPFGSDFTDALAIRATRLILDNLLSVYQSGREREARQNMHVASTLSGLARSNSAAGLGQAFAHVFSARFGLSHGLATSLFLVPVIQCSMPGCDRFDELAAALEFANKEQLLITVFRLRGQLNLPESIPDAGISAKTVNESRDQIFDEILRDPSTGGSPGTVSKALLEEVLKLVHFEPEVSSCADTSLM